MSLRDGIKLLFLGCNCGDRVARAGYGLLTIRGPEWKPSGMFSARCWKLRSFLTSKSVNVVRGSEFRVHVSKSLNFKI